MAIVHKTSDSSLIFIFLMMEERERKKRVTILTSLLLHKKFTWPICVCVGGGRY